MIDISINGLPTMAALQVKSPSWEESCETSESFNKISKALSTMPLPATQHLAKERISKIEVTLPFIRTDFHTQSKELSDLRARESGKVLHTFLHVLRLAGAVAAVAGIVLGATLLTGAAAAAVITTCAVAHLAIGIINLNYTFEDYSGRNSGKNVMAKVFGAAIGLGVLTPLYDLIQNHSSLTNKKEKLEEEIRTGIKNTHSFYEENAEAVRKGIEAERDFFHDANNREPYDKALKFFNEKIPQIWTDVTPTVPEEDLRLRLLNA